MILATPVMVFASSGEADMAKLWKGFGYRVLVFVIFFAVLYKLLKKPILNVLDNRTKDIEKAIADAKEASENAKTELTNYEIKMKGFESDLETMKEKSLKAADAEKQLILEDAEKQIEKLQQFAENLIDSEARKAKEDIKKEAVAKALEAVSEKLEKDLTPAKQKELLNEYIKKIGVQN
jgi:F-type H+-transporting ATPase subunit b